MRVGRGCCIGVFEKVGKGGVSRRGGGLGRRYWFRFYCRGLVWGFLGFRFRVLV